MVLSRVQSYYDDESFSGTNFGTATQIQVKAGSAGWKLGEDRH